MYSFISFKQLTWDCLSKPGLWGVLESLRSWDEAKETPWTGCRSITGSEGQLPWIIKARNTFWSEAQYSVCSKSVLSLLYICVLLWLGIIIFVSCWTQKCLNQQKMKNSCVLGSSVKVSQHGWPLAVLMLSLAGHLAQPHNCISHHLENNSVSVILQSKATVQHISPNDTVFQDL